jgi:signal transduction histidine kinase
MVELDVQIPQLPDAIATTAYYVASEALTNALRHAAPSRIRITASAHEGTLRMRIDDDGSGGASLTPTGGLTGLADRVAALGGELAVDSRRGTGTTVEARLPCAS